MRGASAPTRAKGFTLLEVMVAVAILAVGMTALLQVQARSALMAEEAKALTVGVQLARAKLYDCEFEMLKRGFSEADFKEEGKFDDEGYDKYYWECHGYKPELPMPDASDITEAATQAGQGGSEDGADDPLGGLGGLAGLGGGGAAGAAGLGVGMIAPVLGQISEVVGDSIRELVVIVRWKQGEIWYDTRVTTHLVDTSAVQAMAGQIGAMSQALGGGIPGLSPPGGSSGAPGDPGKGGAPVSPFNPQIPPAMPRR